MSKKEFSSDQMQSAGRLREIRENLNLSQEKFAEIVGISLPGYKKLESGENNLSLSSLRRIRKEIGVSSDYILFGKMESADDLWKAILNCSEEDKLTLLLKLLFYFTRMKKGVFSLKEDKQEEIEMIVQLVEKLQYRDKE